jgi:ADP-ribose pyrophosphatase YjhB (NUDIX family)
VIEDDKVLLVKRAKEPWAGAWCAPGGFCEAGEHPIETVERETLEETGLRVAVTGYIGVWVDEYADEEAAPSVDVINVAYYTAVPLGGPEGKADESEVSELRWFSRDELPRSLAPPRTLPTVLAAASVPMPIRDHPTTARTPPR